MIFFAFTMLKRTKFRYPINIFSSWFCLFFFQLKLEQEKKEKKKQKEKERKERLKAEGKLLTSKQKADRARAQATLEALKAQGLDVPDASVERKPRPGTRIRPKKTKTDLSTPDQSTY